MHYNIQVSIQQVGEVEEQNPPRRASATTSNRKVVVDLLSLRVTATTEQEAYRKARTMLRAATPEVPSGPVTPALEEEEEEEEEF